jgi:hypothetical protein
MIQKVALFHSQTCNVVSSFQKFETCKHFDSYIGATIFLIRVLLAANMPAIALQAHDLMQTFSSCNLMSEVSDLQYYIA